MEKVKFGVIGLGVMGHAHVKTLQSIEHCELVAVCDTDPRQIEKIKKDETVKPGFTVFTDYRKLIDSGLCDAVAVVTPHPLHLEISEYAFTKTLHVMCDKPIAITVAEADKMLAAWRKSGSKFSTVYSMRTSGVNKTVKALLNSGVLGKILRVEMTCTKWLRTQKYYDSQNWRGTWVGEGGGLLMNQAPHNLDLLYWWFGPAKEIQAELGNRMHSIETEDEVRALIRTENGIPISFYANTGEAPGKDYVEIVADNGTLIKQDNKLIWEKLPQSLDKIVMNSNIPIPLIEVETLEPEIPDIPCGHRTVFASFIDNILQGRPNTEQEAPGNEGIHAVEWANAMLTSHVEKRKISLPLDRQRYDFLLTAFRENKQKL